MSLLSELGRAARTPDYRLTLMGQRISPQAGDQHRYSVTDRDAYTGVAAQWHDDGAAEPREVVAGSDDEAKRLRPTYATEDDALAAAQSEWQRLQRGGASFTLDPAEGRPEDPGHAERLGARDRRHRLADHRDQPRPQLPREVTPSRAAQAIVQSSGGQDERR